MRIVVIGDIHWYQLRVLPWQLLGKRLLGQANLWLNRRKRFDLSLMAEVVSHACALDPQVLLLSGDLTTTSLPGEFDAALDALEPLIEKSQTVIAVPGNHDRYTRGAMYGKVVERKLGALLPEPMPALRRLNARWSVLALDAAVPRGLSSRGRLGANALVRTRELLDSLGSDQGVLILCHYALGSAPGRKPMKPGHRLDEENALLEVISNVNVQVVYLHGHVHDSWQWQRGGRLLDINAGSPTMLNRAFPLGQGFWEINLNAKDGQLHLTHHFMQPTDSGSRWQNQSIAYESF